MVTVRRFGIRFGICLLVLGAIYAAVVILQTVSRNQPSVTQRLAAVHASLDQSYVDGTSLANFHESGILSGTDLSGLLTQFKDDTAKLKSATSAAHYHLSNSEYASLQTIISRQQQAADNLQARYTPVAQVIAYDPATDLTGASSTLQTRAQAAAKGLHHALTAAGQPATTGNTGIIPAGGNAAISQAVQNRIQQTANCFDQLTTELQKHQTAAANKRRQACVKAYPTLRQAVIEDVINHSFDNTYRAYMRQTVPKLLAKLQ